MLPPDHKDRWLTNLKAAGVEPDEGTLERVEPGLAERISDLKALFDRLDFHNSNPDYLHARSETEPRDGRA